MIQIIGNNVSSCTTTDQLVSVSVGEKIYELRYDGSLATKNGQYRCFVNNNGSASCEFVQQGSLVKYKIIVF